MKLIGVCGSLRRNSVNAAMLKALAGLVQAPDELSLAPGIEQLPHVNPDLERPLTPSTVTEWRQSVANADGVVICSPEYAHGIPGPLKNALDWLVYSGELYAKPVALIMASPSYAGAPNALSNLRQTLLAQQAKLADDSVLNIPMANKKLNADGSLNDGGLREDLRACLLALRRTIANAAD